MDQRVENSESWSEVESGYLAEMARGRRRAVRRRTVVQMAATAAATTFLIVVGGWATGVWRSAAPGENGFGGITCPEVGANMSAYIAGDLAPSRAKQVEAHLAHCKRCREMHKKMQASTQNGDPIGPNACEPQVARSHDGLRGLVYAHSRRFDRLARHDGLIVGQTARP